MFRSFWFFIVSAFLIFVAGTTASTEDLSTVYTNAEKGFSVRLPSNWEIKEGKGGVDLTAVSPPNEASGNQYRPYVTISIENLPQMIPLIDYATNRLNKYRAQMTDLTFLKTGRQVISHTNARWWIITYSEKTVNLKGFIFIAMKGNRAFTIFAVSTLEQYPRYKDVLSDIGGSLTIF